MIKTIITEIKTAHPNISKAIAIGLAVMAIVFTIDVFQEPADERMKRISKQFQTVIDDYDEQLKDARNEKSKLQSTLYKLENTVSKKKRAIKDLTLKSKKDQESIAKLNKSIDKLKSEYKSTLSKHKTALAKAIKESLFLNNKRIFSNRQLVRLGVK